MASTWVNDNISSPGKIIFFSDSQAALNALNRTFTSSRLVLDIADQLTSLGTAHNVELRWVPGHNGVEGNELADSLAREGSSTTPIGPEPFLPRTPGVITGAIKEYLFNIHLKRYNNIALSDKGKTPIKTYLMKYRYKAHKLSGKHLKWITWLLTGHSPLAYFQHKSHNPHFETPDCEHCPGEPETSEHFLCVCVGYMTIRLHTLGKAIFTIEELVLCKINHIIKFIELTGRFDRDNLFG